MHRNAADLGDLRGRGGFHDLRRDAFHHLAEVVRVQRCDDAVLRRELAAVLRRDADGAAAFRADCRDVHFAEHFAAVRLDARDQRVRELARAAHRHAEAKTLEETDEHECAEPRRFLVGRHEVLARHAREVHAYLVVLEHAAEKIVRAHLHIAPQLAAFAALVHERVGSAERGGRGVERAEEHRHVAGRFVGEPAVRVGVALLKTSRSRRTCARDRGTGRAWCRLRTPTSSAARGTRISARAWL